MNNLKNNIKSKTWWIAVISLLLLIAQSHGLDLTKYIGEDWQTTLGNIFALLALMGINTNHGGVPNETIQEVSQEESISTVTDNTNVVANNQQLTELKLQQIQQIINS